MYAVRLITAMTMIVSTMAEIPREMMALVNKDVKPCVNFYQYACGGWMKKHGLQPTQNHMDSSYSVVDTRNANLLSTIIKEDRPMVSELWDSCMDLATISKLGNKPLHKDLNRIIHAKTKDEVMALAGEFARTGTFAFASYRVDADKTDSRINTLHIGVADVILSKRSSYKTYVNKLMKLAGYPPSSKKYTFADTVVMIEKKLATFHSHPRDVAHVSISHASSKWPFTVGSYMKGLGIFDPSSTVRRSLKFHLESPGYFTAVEKYIEDLSLNDLKVYLAFVMTHSRVYWMGSHFSFAYEKYFVRKQLASRHQFCMNIVIASFPDLLGKFYSMKAFNKEKEQQVQSMIKSIRLALKDRIDDSTWFDQETKKEANDKLSKLLHFVGQSSVAMVYPFKISRTNYPTNIYKILSSAATQKLKKLGQPVDRNEWEISPVRLQAYYSPQRNSIVFPAALLQEPFFYADVHPARNYGGIGTIIGRELSHVFDSKGRLYDGEGNVRPWWSIASDKEFAERTKCLKTQYPSFKVRGQKGRSIGKLNDELTMYEDVADHAGVGFAWDAYREYMYNAQPETDGVSATDGDKMFFLAYAQLYCSHTRDRFMQEKLVTSSFSPNEWRVNGVLQNNHEFARTFECTIDAPMYPIDQCRVW